MKRLILFLLFLSAPVVIGFIPTETGTSETHVLPGAQTSSNGSSYEMKVRVYFDYPDQVNSLLPMGLDIVYVKKSAPGGFLDILMNAEELKEVEAMGFRTEILIPDLTAYHQNLGGGILAISFGPYYTYAEMVTAINQIASDHPTITRIDSIGSSIQGRTIWAVKVSDNPMIEEGEPEALFNGVHHAREPIGVSISIDLLNTLTDNYGTDPRITFIVDNREVWVIPVVNPDGYVYNETDPSGMWRKNRRDNGGGEFGVDLNRNYGFMWGYDDIGSSPDPWDETYRGTGPFSEPETQAIRDFVTAHEFVISLNYHSHSNLLLFPWGYADIYTPEDAIFRDLSEDMTAINGYPYGTAWELLYNTNGDADDWMYGDTTKPRIFAFTPEVGEDFWQPDTCTIVEQIDENRWMNLYTALASGLYLLQENLTIADGGGNNNGRLDPGETVDLTLFLKNLSPLDDASGVEALLSTCDSYTELESRQSSLGDILSRATGDNGADPFTLSIDSLTPQGHPVNFLLTITANGGAYSVEEPFTLLVGQPPTFFTDGFDAGSGNWIWQSPWARTASVFNSPPYSATDSPIGNYGNDANISLTKATPLDLTNASYAELQFYHRYFFENGYDFGFVEVSTDGGSCWNILSRYTGTLSTWTQVTLPLSRVLGYSSVQLRFRLVSDSFIRADGWYIDDVLIAATTSTNTPPSAPTLNFPPNDTTLTITTPDLIVNNAIDPDGDTLAYGFRVYSDSLLTQLVASVDGIPEGVATTSWTVSPPLMANTQYWWRAYAEDGESRSACMMDPATFHIGNVGVEEESDFRFPPESSSGSDFRLIQNQPNPFHSTTTIRYQIPLPPLSKGDQGGFRIPVRLVVYDITGKLVEILVDEPKEPGIYQLPITNHQFPGSGIYFYRLTAGGLTSTRKMLLLK